MTVLTAFLAVTLAAGASAPGAAGAAAPGAGDASPAAQALAARVQAYYEKTTDLEARFVQTYTYAAFGRRQVSSGRFAVKKPGRLRWDYEKPEPKVVLVSGKKLVQWEPAAHQVYVDERFDATAMSAAVSFLLGQGKLASEFRLAVDPEGRLLLTPKEEDPRVESIALTVGSAGEVTASRVVDGSGNVNEVAFSELRRNVGLPDARFELAIPKDAQRLQAPR
jgi:outer membrane lipoprotein carrier protein